MEEAGVSRRHAHGPCGSPNVCFLPWVLDPIVTSRPYHSHSILFVTALAEGFQTMKSLCVLGTGGSAGSSPGASLIGYLLMLLKWLSHVNVFKPYLRWSVLVSIIFPGIFF